MKFFLSQKLLRKFASVEGMSQYSDMASKDKCLEISSVFVTSKDKRKALLSKYLGLEDEVMSYVTLSKVKENTLAAYLSFHNEEVARVYFIFNNRSIQASVWNKEVTLIRDGESTK